MFTSGSYPVYLGLALLSLTSVVYGMLPTIRSRVILLSVLPMYFRGYVPGYQIRESNANPMLTSGPITYLIHTAIAN